MKKDCESFKQIDLRGKPCPVNFIHCRLAMESLGPADSLQVDLDRGEPEKMVISGLKNEGHQVEILKTESSWVRLLVIAGVR